MYRLSAAKPIWFAVGVLSTLLANHLAGASLGQYQQQIAPSKTAPAQLPADKAASDGKLHIIAFGAHPDDCELKVAGTAAKWAALGHHVKFVSVTNGDVGHWGMAGGPLAKRRRMETEHCGKILGIQAQVLDIHDGELL